MFTAAATLSTHTRARMHTAHSPRTRSTRKHAQTGSMRWHGRHGTDSYGYSSCTYTRANTQQHTSSPCPSSQRRICKTPANRISRAQGNAVDSRSHPRAQCGEGAASRGARPRHRSSCAQCQRASHRARNNRNGQPRHPRWPAHTIRDRRKPQDTGSLA